MYIGSGTPHYRRLDRPDQRLLLAVDIPPPPAGMLPAAERM